MLSKKLLVPSKKNVIYLALTFIALRLSGKRKDHLQGAAE